MGNENLLTILVISFGCCCTIPMIVISGIYLGVYGSALTSLNDFSHLHLTGDKFEIDWNNPLISDIYVKGKKEKCNGIDQPVIHLPWFGYNHMCVSGYKKKAYRGFTCEVSGKLIIGDI